MKLHALNTGTQLVDVLTMSLQVDVLTMSLQLY
jgi:hypothetical protein